ncbi:hypothetical protein K461DRAFT_167103 [Myriangium duriaei CBS 260.36]|uniref:Uncharacterized protein n=1 Tax=Myriangium duriaei CBS 260.36 TaxID=1168546 RepID=A0A9P4J0M5_9PEZI|nr:hypothetical protein K461DRAFT_167103 [Myriangium duriaei CBS 260.36]
MFCTTLRQRPALSAVVQPLLSHPTIRIKESRLTTHDIVIPLTSDNKRKLFVLLFCADDLGHSKVTATKQHLTHFTSFTTPQDLAVIFLLTPNDAQSGSEAYARLQALMLDPDIPAVSILLSASPVAIPQVLQTYVAALNAPLLSTSKQATPEEVLLTAGQVSKYDVDVSRELFCSLGEMIRGCAVYPARDRKHGRLHGYGNWGQTGAGSGSGDGCARLVGHQDSVLARKIEDFKDIVGEHGLEKLLRLWGA